MKPRQNIFLAVSSLAAAMISIQAGAAIAKGLFPVLGPEATTSLRVLIAAVLLLCIYRPWRDLRWLREPGARRMLLAYGIALGAMNLLYYIALRGLPLGIVVAIEFLGPLTVAVATSRRGIDFVWIVLAVIGLALLLPWPGSNVTLDPWSVAAALGAGLGWGLYIVFGQRLGNYAPAGPSVSLGMVIAAIVVLPWGIAFATPAMVNVDYLPAIILVAVLSSAIPYPLEMRALQWLPARSFGILMSMEPALAAFAGFLMLDERLTSLQWIAICSVVLASAGTAITVRDEVASHPAPPREQR